MRAIVRDRFGPPEVLHLEDVEKPTPGAGEVLIKIHAAAVSSGDCRARSFKNIPKLFWFPSRLIFGITRPRQRILGSEFSGEIESIGDGVTLFKTGDSVFGYTGLKFGAYAEYVSLPEEGAIVRRPANMTHKEAAGVPFGALTALYFLRAGNIGPGMDVLVNGASGAVGAAAVQLAAHFGARVTGVCSTGKMDLVRWLGAGHVFDYTKEDFTEADGSYDIIFDTVGTAKFSRCRGVMKPGGRFVTAVFGATELLQMLWTSMAGGKKVICGVSAERAEDLVFIKELIEAGNVKSVIDKIYPLEDTPAAHAYVDQGHKTGSVVIDVAGCPARRSPSEG